ncbi:hypothetical protein [Streptomyces sp. NPDC058632]
MSWAAVDRTNLPCGRAALQEEREVPDGCKGSLRRVHRKRGMRAVRKEFA